MQSKTAVIDLDLRLAEDAWDAAIPELQAICARALNVAAAQTHIAGSVSLLLTDNAEIQTLNRDWRGKDRPTDVLSFPADAMDRPFLGDIAIAFGVMQADALARGLTLPQHLSHLLIHGLLHLLGHDHKDDTEAVEMEAVDTAV